MRTIPAREFWSVALARLCFPATRSECAAVIGLPPLCTVDSARAFTCRLTRGGSLPTFMARLGPVARELDSNPRARGVARTRLALASLPFGAAEARQPYGSTFAGERDWLGGEDGAERKKLLTAYYIMREEFPAR